MPKRSRLPKPRNHHNHIRILYAIALSTPFQELNEPITTLGPFSFTQALKLTSLGFIVDDDRDGGIASWDYSDHKAENGASNAPRDSFLDSIDGDNDSSLSGRTSCPQVYGVDRSFPIHHSFVETNDYDDEDGVGCPFDGKEQQKFYSQFIEGCRKDMGSWGYLCDESEAVRIRNNLLQPPMMKVRLFGKTCELRDYVFRF